MAAVKSIPSQVEGGAAMDMEPTFGMRKEMKHCGHVCYPSNLKGCCSCSDLRPVEDSYENYVDGEGYCKTAERDAYCECDDNPHTQTPPLRSEPSKH
jgi:hypothetical protein